MKTQLADALDSRRRPSRGVLIGIAVAALVLLMGARAQAQGSAPDAAPLNLRPRPEAGKVSRFDFWSVRQQDSSTRLPNGQSVGGSSRMEMNGRLNWSVERVRGDGASTCVLSFEWITTTVSSGREKARTIDTRRPAGGDNPAHKMLSALVGVPIRCEVSADGTIIRATGFQVIQQRMDNAPGAPDEADFIETATELATIAGAPAAAAMGSQWGANFRWNHELGKLDQSMRYRVTGVEDIAGVPVATVMGTGKPRFEAGPRGQALPPNVSMTMQSGRTDTQVYFDLDRHEAVGRNTLDSRTFVIRVQVQGKTITTQVNERVQSQALRVAEE